MITDFNTLATTLRSTGTTSRRPSAANRYRRPGIDSALNLGRLAREELFERTHSFWAPNLLDRLSSPLSRIHE